MDLAEYFKPRLTIVDAVECMEGNGPTGGTPRHMGAVLAGENPHKVPHHHVRTSRRQQLHQGAHQTGMGGDRLLRLGGGNQVHFNGSPAWTA